MDDDGAATFTVTVEPAAIELACRNDETLIQCAWRHGYYWPTICGGAGECGACRCEVTSGSEHMMAEDAAEAIFFRTHPKIRQNSPSARLACCLRVTGPVTVAKAGVKPRG